MQLQLQTTLSYRSKLNLFSASQASKTRSTHSCNCQKPSIKVSMLKYFLSTDREIRRRDKVRILTKAVSQVSCCFRQCLSFISIYNSVWIILTYFYATYLPTAGTKPRQHHNYFPLPSAQVEKSQYEERFMLVKTTKKDVWLQLHHRMSKKQKIKSFYDRKRRPCE